MKDSGIPWIGSIPTTWDVVQLSSIFKEHKDKNKLLEENNLLSLSYGRIIRKDINTKEGLLPQSFDGYNIIQKGDIVFRLTDLQNDKRSLRTGLCKEKGIITSAYISIRKTQELHSEFFHYLLHSYDECKVFYGLGDGVRQGMTFDDLRKLLLVVPPFQLQQQIANFLDDKCADIDQLIALQQQMIDELKAYKQSVITEAVCKGLDKSVPMKDSGIEWIGEVPEGWEILPISKIGKVSSSKRVFEEEYTDKGIPFFRSKEVSELSGGLDTSTEIFISEQTYSRVTKISSAPKIGDMLLTSIGTIGKTWIADGRKFYYKDGNLTQISSEEWNNTKYIQYCFKSNIIIEQYNRLSVGSTLLALTMVKIKNMILTYPPLEEQSIIVKYLDNKCSQIDTLISIKQQKIDELKEYKKSMIYEYITGKKQVPN